jgi:hypothetical protein
MAEPFTTTTIMMMVMGKLTAVPVAVTGHGAAATAALSAKALAAKIAAAMF